MVLQYLRHFEHIDARITVFSGILNTPFSLNLAMNVQNSLGNLCKKGYNFEVPFGSTVVVRATVV
jgi:hypothetical protein